MNIMIDMRDVSGSGQKKEEEKWYGSAGSDCNQEEYAELQAGSGGGGKAGKDPGGGAAGAQRRE